MFNVQMTKMVADWFAGQAIATAMAIFVNSWPAGIAPSLVLLPQIGSTFGVEAVYLTVAASIALGLVFFAAAYQSPPKIVATAGAGPSWPDRSTFIALTVAGLIWAFSTRLCHDLPSMLDERGWSISAAGSAISIVLWLAVISVPLGGVLADRTKRPNLVLVAGCIIFAVLMVILPRGGAVISTITAIGLLSGLPVGPMLSLPAGILKAQTRAIGMGIFYTLYYATMMLGPVVAGALAKSTGSAASALDFGAAVLLACPLLLWAFNRLPHAQPKMA
jgi:Major Facilitator Superfamily